LNLAFPRLPSSFADLAFPVVTLCGLTELGVRLWLTSIEEETMREPGFAASWAMPIWTAPVAFIDGKPVLDSLTGQPVQEHDHVVQDEESAAVSVGPVDIGSVRLYWGECAGGARTGLHATPEDAAAEEKNITQLWRMLVSQDLSEFEEILPKFGLGLCPLDVDEELPNGLSLSSVNGIRTPSIALVQKDSGGEYHCIALFEGASYKAIKDDLYAWLRHNGWLGGGGPGGI